MEIRIFDNPIELGDAAANEAIGTLAAAIKEKESTTIIPATGQSQFATLSRLTATKENDWRGFRFFIYEYIGPGYVGVSDLPHSADYRFATRRAKSGRRPGHTLRHHHPHVPGFSAQESPCLYSFSGYGFGCFYSVTVTAIFSLIWARSK